MREENKLRRLGPPSFGTWYLKGMGYMKRHILWKHTLHTLIS